MSQKSDSTEDEVRNEVARRQRIKSAYDERRRTWMRQRMVEEERQKVASECKTDEVGKCRNGGDYKDSASRGSEDILERLTGRIASRLRVELRDEVERELKSAESMRDAAEAEKTR